MLRFLGHHQLASLLLINHHHSSHPTTRRSNLNNVDVSEEKESAVPAHARNEREHCNDDETKRTPQLPWRHL